MHIPKSFEEYDTSCLLEFIHQHPLGSLITHIDGDIDGCHIPFLVNADESNSRIVLEGHIARANDLWRRDLANKQILVIFQGPDTYISPNHYPSKLETNKAVPTWNYASAHAKGTIRFFHDKNWLMSFLERFTDLHESANPEPWKIADAPTNYITRMLKAIVGVEITVESLAGNFKLSQNKADEDRQGVISGLASSHRLEDRRVSEFMLDYYANK